MPSDKKVNTEFVMDPLVALGHRVLGLIEKSRESLGSVGTFIFLYIFYITVFGSREHRYEFIEQVLLAHGFPKEKAGIIYLLATIALFFIIWLQHRHHQGLIGAKDGRIAILEKRLQRYENPMDGSGSQPKLSEEM